METIQTILELVYLGAMDCIYGSLALKTLCAKKNKPNKEQSQTPRPRTSDRNAQSKSIFDVFMQCIVFGFLIWFSIFVFHFAVMRMYNSLVTALLYPEEELSISWVPGMMSFMFTCMWKCPMFFASRILTFVWYQDIANMTCEDVGIKRRVTQSRSEEWSEQFMSAFVQTLFLIQGYLVFLFPMPVWMQNVLSILHLALLYALYAFEYRWCQKGWSMNRRLSYIECKWPYFMGFGLPLAILTSCVQTYIESICVFSVLFPVTLIASTVTFNQRLQSFNKPLRFFGLATPVANSIVCNVFGLIYK